MTGIVLPQRTISWGDWLYYAGDQITLPLSLYNDMIRAGFITPVIASPAKP